MRDRYYVRKGKVEKPLSAVSVLCYREWHVNRDQPYTEFRDKWLLENYNIVINKQANGVEKVGFASKGDMLMFMLRWS